MNESSILSIYECRPTGRNGVLLSRLQKEFEVLPFESIPELQSVIKARALFCLLIHGRIHEEGDLQVIRRLCSAAYKTPCLFYGNVNDHELAFQLSPAGVNHFVENGNSERLVEKLRELKAQAKFRIDLREFGIELQQCGYWPRRFLQFISRDFNFIKYCSVSGIAKQLNTSGETLRLALRNDGLLSPKQYVLCFRNFYAAYLFSQHAAFRTSHIAQCCGFSSERDLYRALSKATGGSVKVLRNRDWREYPAQFLENENID